MAMRARSAPGDGPDRNTDDYGRQPARVPVAVDRFTPARRKAYTHFGGMPGLWSAVRQEGFTRLAERLANVGPTQDPVRDLVALGAAHVANALPNPHLYRAMFDAAAELENPDAAHASFGALVSCAARATAAASRPPAIPTRSPHSSGRSVTG